MIVADGDVPPRHVLDEAWPGWGDGIETVIAADGGLVRAGVVGLVPTLVVGDLDSLDPSLVSEAESAGVRVRRAAVDKDESDAELALLEALRLGATRVTVLGALGGSRIDHSLANVWLLAHPAATSVDLQLLDASARISLVTAPGPGGGPVGRSLPGRVGALVSLFPVGGDALGITTTGLRYPLVAEPLLMGAARGLSNVRESEDAALTLDHGRLLVVETAT